jgi:RimJ/RimL family protein N-acetyltransferase
LRRETDLAVQQRPTEPITSRPGGRDWRERVPELADEGLLLREVRLDDATSLLAHVGRQRVLQYISPCPTASAGFRRFIRWTHDQRKQGRYVCYGVIPRGEAQAIGILQMWSVEPDFSTAEWGFVIGERYWGTGLFLRSAALFLDAAFTTFGVLRLEARAVVANARGNAVLRKLGATPEGVLRRAFRRDGVVSDHVMWSILAEEWIAKRDDLRGTDGER